MKRQLEGVSREGIQEVSASDGLKFWLYFPPILLGKNSILKSMIG